MMSGKMRAFLVLLTAAFVFTVVLFILLVPKGEPSARQKAFNEAPVLKLHMAVIMAEPVIDGKYEMGAEDWTLAKMPVRTARVDGFQWVHFGVLDRLVRPGWICYVTDWRMQRRDADSPEGATQASYQLEPLKCSPEYEGLSYYADHDGTLEEFAQRVFAAERAVIAKKPAERAAAELEASTAP